MALQMTWQAHRRKSPPVGLKNLGNTCYLNSVLQCLTFTAPFANFCLAGQHSSSCPSWNSSNKGANCPFCLVERRIAKSLISESQVNAPAEMVSSLHLFSKQFRPGRQEDAHEFLRFVIDACDDVSIKIYKAQNKVGTKQLKQEPKTIIKEIFGGVLQSQIKCLSCGAESNKFDEILDINLDILDFGSLKEGLCRLSQSELLDGSNKYNCEKCKKLSAARKQLLISQAPNVLVIQLKRFEDAFGGKIDRHIIFEEHLDLSSHMSRASQDPRPEYTLFGTVVHSGYSQDSGHYYAYVKDVNARWYCCNDAHVSAATIHAVLAEKVYMLFFLRSNAWPKRGKEKMASNGVDRTNSVGNGDVSLKQRTSTMSNSSLGVSSSRGSLNNGSTKLHLKPQLKIANLKHAGSHLGKTGIIENGNGTCKSDTRVMESESSERNASGKTYLDASFSSNSSVLTKEESLTHNKPSEPNFRIGNGNRSSSSYQSSLLNKVSEHSETNGQCCKNDSVKGNILKNLSDGDSIPGSNGHLHVDKLQKPTSNASCNYKTELSRAVSKNDVGEHIGSSFPDESDGSTGKQLFKRRKEHENMYRGNGHTEQVDIVLQHNFDSKVKSDLDGVENPSEIDKLIEILCQEAREHLQSCGWCDDVRDAMRAKKRMCVDQMHLLVENVEYREFLIQSVRDSHIRQIPDSIKGQLLDRLRSFFNGKR